MKANDMSDLLGPDIVATPRGHRPVQAKSHRREYPHASAESVSSTPHFEAIAIWLAATCVFGCSVATLNPTPLVPSAQHAGRSVMVEEPKIVIGPGQDCKGFKPGDAWGPFLAEASRAALERAGFAISKDSQTAPDYVARPVLTFNRCFLDNGFFGIGAQWYALAASLSIAIEPGDTAVAACDWEGGRSLAPTDMSLCALEAVARLEAGTPRPTAGHDLEWIENQNSRGLCGDPSEAGRIIEEFPENSASDAKAKSTMDDLLRRIAGHRSTDSPVTLWGEWTVQLDTFVHRCKKGPPSDRIARVTKATGASISEDAVSEAVKTERCKILLAVERLDAWPFGEMLLTQGAAERYSDSEVTRRLWIATLESFQKSCAAGLTARQKMSLQSRQRHLEQLVSLDDELLVRFRKELWKAIHEGRVDQASNLATAVSQRENLLSHRAIDAEIQAVQLAEAKRNAEEAARRWQQTPETGPVQESNSNSWFNEMMKGAGEGFGRSVGCHTFGNCNQIR